MMRRLFQSKLKCAVRRPMATSAYHHVSSTDTDRFSSNNGSEAPFYWGEGIEVYNDSWVSEFPETRYSYREVRTTKVSPDTGNIQQTTEFYTRGVIEVKSGPAPPSTSSSRSDNHMHKRSFKED